MVIKEGGRVVRGLLQLVSRESRAMVELMRNYQTQDIFWN